MDFSKVINKKLVEAGLLGAFEISERTEPSGFEDSESIWGLGNLRFRFIKDRGQQFIDIGSRFKESKYFIFDDVALLMRWQTLDGILNANEPLELREALRFIKNDLKVLEELFSKEKINETEKQLDEISDSKTHLFFE